MQIVGDNRIIFSFLSDSVIAKMPELPRNYSFKTAHRIKTTSHNINQSHAATDSQEPGHQPLLTLALFTNDPALPDSPDRSDLAGAA